MEQQVKYDKSRLRVFATCCDACLFSANKVVSDKSKEAILAKVERKGSFFACHKAEHVMCRAFYDRYRQRSLLIWLAEDLGRLTFEERTASSE